MANILELQPLAAAIQLPVDTDRQLLDRYQTGDRDLFTTLYRAHHASVFRFTFHMTGDAVEASDIVQDVFVWLLHHANLFDPERGPLIALLIGVARKLVQKRHRQEQRWISIDDELLSRYGNGHTTVEVTNQNDIEALRVAILLLPIRYREVVVLCDLEDQTYEQAAVALNCAVGTVRSRLHRGRSLLARKFQPAKEQARKETL